jgi:hypothetical protein
MDCINHPNVAALGRCAGCAEPFCKQCLVAVGGQSYCAKCKVMAVTKQPVVGEPNQPCPEAGEALKYAIIGIFCFGFILGPMAISKALKAKKMIAEDPSLSGGGKATAALVIGILDVVFFVLFVIGKVNAAH